MSGEAADWVLAGDIGGTQVRLGLFADRDGALVGKCLERVSVASFEEPEDLLGEYLDRCEVRPRSACLGLAGPVLNGRCRMTNIDWVFEAEFLAQQLSLSRVDLLNDLEAMALGLDDLEPSARHTLRQGRPLGNQRIGLLAVDSGLGEALRFNLDKRINVVSGEGGHADFAASTERDCRLRDFLAERHGGHVSWERVLSASGLVAIYELLCGEAEREPVTRDEKEPDEVVIRRGLESGDALCAAALHWFVELLAAEAGNLALRGLCVDGVYLGGRLPPRLRRFLEAPEFMQRFSAKGRFRNLLEQVPLYLVSNDDAALLGAARHALRTLDVD